MRATTDTPYQSLLLENESRLRSMVDRDPFSLTFGCFDRLYWCWKFTDFPGSRFQEGLLTLAWYSLRENATANASLMAAGFEFWRGLQNGDGSFDEAYPMERSFAATAFTGFYVGEAYLRWRQYLGERTRADIEKTLARAGHWLCVNDETHGVLSNHLAAAAAALHRIAGITGERRFKERRDYFLRRILAHQSREGWYREYGGADPGYQTHGMFYLALIQKEEPSPVLRASLVSACRFMQWFVHPDGTVGGEYASRNTMFYFPAAFEILAADISEAGAIAAIQRVALKAKRGVGVWSMDAQNFIPMLNNYIFASENQSSAAGGLLTLRRENSILFPDAGFYVSNSHRCHLVVGIGKGGVIKLFRHDTGHLAMDGGYVIILPNGENFTSQWAGGGALVWQSGNGLKIKGGFYRIRRKVFTPWLFILFRLTSLVLGRLPLFSRLLKKILVKVLVSRKEQLGASLSREVVFNGNGVAVLDEVRGIPPGARLCTAHRFSTIHMGSSWYASVDQEQVGSDCAECTPIENGVYRRKMEL